MASVFQKPKSAYWYAAFRGPSNERTQRSTKQRSKADAIRIAQEWERLANMGRKRMLTEAQARTVVSQIVEYALGEPLHFHSCRAWLKEWLAGKRGAVAARSLEKYEQVIGEFLEHLGERADLPLAGIGPRDVRSFRDSMASGRRSAGTVNQTVRKVLTAPFAAAVRLGYVTMNPCAAVEALKDDADAERDTFTSEQVAELVNAAEGDWKGAVMCGFYTGLRLRDVTDLRWECVDFDASVLRLKTRKAGAVLTLPLHPELAEWLRSHRRGIGKAPVFPTLAGKGTGGRHGLSGRFSTIMEKAGVRGKVLRGADGKGRKTHSLSFHSLRHSFVSALANAGVSQELRRKLSGHADERSHARYTHHEMEVLRTAVEKLPGLAG